MVEKLVAYLQMTDPQQLRPASRVTGLEIIRVTDPAVVAERIQPLHDAIATPHHWSSLGRSEEQWRQSAESADRLHWVATVDDMDIGWASLDVTDVTDVADVEIAGFGILPERVGRGYGGAFLTALVRQAWQLAAPAKVGRIWLRTSSWDHPHALVNYQARGFKITRLVIEHRRAGTNARQSTPVTQPPRFLVRPAITDDADAVATLIADLGYSISIKTVRQRLATSASSLDDVVAVAIQYPDSIVGVISAHVIPLLAEQEAGVMRITALSVSPNSVRNGVGRRLVDFVEYAARQRRIRLLEVSSGRRPERAAAHRFYPSLGFHDSAASSVRYWKPL